MLSERMITAAKTRKSWYGFKHVDVVDSAVNLDKLRGIGFHLDEIREMVGYPLLNTEFSTERALTKNYGGEGNSNAAQET